MTENNTKIATLKTAIIVNDLKSARRLMSRIISEFQRGNIKSEDAKTLSYLLSTYLQIAKGYEFEERLDKIENSLEGRNE